MKQHKKQLKEQRSFKDNKNKFQVKYLFLVTLCLKNVEKLSQESLKVN